MERVVVLGRGGAGKSTAARRLGELVGLPVIELDTHFWDDTLLPMEPAAWVRVQSRLADRPAWVMDGDLGPHDALPVRLGRADTVLVLDLPLAVCMWRAVRRSRERWDFWWWVITWRRRSRGPLLRSVAAFAPAATVHVFRRSRDVERFLESVTPDR